jgi:integral membrane protein (TIGR01906 family)
VTGYDEPVNSARARIASILIGLATAIVIVAVVILPFLSPQWVAFEQGRAQATAWTGFTTEELRTATDAILADLVLGGDFAVEIDGTPVLVERERQHMTDVRTVFRGLWILAAISAVGLVVASRRRDRAGTWRAVRGGAIGLTIGVVVAGVVGLLAFDQLFELFHRIFFPAGSYLFDPATDRLVQLFPFAFWEETAMVVGAAIIVAALVVAAVAGRRARRGTNAAPAAADLTRLVEPGT